MSDRHEDKRPGQGLDLSRETYATLFRLNPDPILLTTEEGRILDANDSWCEFVGSPRQEVIGLATTEIGLLDPSARQSLLELLREEGSLHDLEIELRIPSGETRPVLFSAAFLEVSGERCIISVAKDLTPLRRVEERLRASETFSRTVAAEMNEGLVVVDARGRIVYVNPAFCELLGYAREELEGRSPKAFLDEVALQTMAVQGARLAEGKGEPYELEISRKDGDRRRLRISPRLIRAPDGDFEGSFGLVTDVTERRRVQAKLRDIERLAAIGNLAAGIGHEINNPLGSILLTAERSLEQVERGRAVDVLRPSLQSIAEQARRCGRVVRTLLRQARREPTEKWAADLNAILARAGVLTAAEASAHGAYVYLYLASELSPVLCNPLEVEQAVVNLVRNAIHSGDDVTVTVSSRAEAEGVALTVTDDGAGLDAEERERIFDPFFTKRREQGGTGLGLSLVHRIVEEQNAEISVVSEPGFGTRVTVLFPLASDLGSIAEAEGA